MVLCVKWEQYRCALDHCISHGDVRILSDREIAIHARAEDSKETIVIRVHYANKKIFKDFGDYIFDIDLIAIGDPPVSVPLNIGDSYSYISDIDGNGVKDRVVIYNSNGRLAMGFKHNYPPRP